MNYINTMFVFVSSLVWRKQVYCVLCTVGAKKANKKNLQQGNVLGS